MRKNRCLIILLLILIPVLCLPGEGRTARKKGVGKVAFEGYQTISETKFRKIFEGYIRDRLRRAPSDITVSKFKVFGNRPVPPGKKTFQLFGREGQRLGGQVRVAAIVKVDGVVKNRVRLSGLVDIFDEVVCVSRPLKRGEVIKRDDLYMARKNISRSPLSYLRDMDRAVGLMVKHSVKEETALKTWMLARSPIVKRGDMVTIVAQSGGLKVTVPGKVLEKGYKGSLIRVLNVMSKKEIHAKVVNHSTVQVFF